MATIEDLKAWIEDDFGRRGLAEYKIHDVTEEWTAEHPKENPYHRIKIYTFINYYTISATEEDDGGYLGCVSTARKSRPGEDWLRGNDLPDGKLTKETWDNIIRGIICYELEDISKLA